MGAIAGKGAAKLYGVRSCQELTKKQMQNLQEYLQSMGFKMVIRCNKTGKDLYRDDVQECSAVTISYELLYHRITVVITLYSHWIRFLGPILVCI